MVEKSTTNVSLLTMCMEQFSAPNVFYKNTLRESRNFSITGVGIKLINDEHSIHPAA